MGSRLQPGCTAWLGGWGDSANPQANTSWPSPRTPPSEEHRTSRPSAAPSSSPDSSSASRSSSSSSSDREHHDSMEEGVSAGTGPSMWCRGRTLVPPSAVLSPGANCDPAAVPLPAPQGQPA